ncbi:MAG: V-type ATP synthase subunit I [Methanohalobium sp.]|uniref:V-type ATP synthase subunit I n=1 Tax=Methanohalobium sp. TaxID=2837493 RepID=UPI00397A9E25
MLEPKPMSRVIVAGHKNIMQDTIEALHSLNVYHIEDYNEEEPGLEIGNPFESAEDVSKKLVKIRSLSNYLGVKGNGNVREDSDKVWNNLDDRLNELDNKVSEKTKEKSELDGKLKDIENLKKDLLPLSNIPLDLDLYRGYENISVFAGTIKGSLENLETDVSSITNIYEIWKDPEWNSIALFVSNDYAGQVSETLSGYSFKEFRIPEMSGVPKDILSKAEEDIQSFENQIESIDQEIESIKKQYSSFILASDELLSIEAEKAEAPLRMATSDNTFVVDGWIPDDEYETMVQSLDKSTNGHAYVSKLETVDSNEHEEHSEEVTPPTEYNNSKLSKPFETVMDLYSRPRYKELDPTSLIFVALPLFYGMMLGDVGYALVLLGVAFGIKKFVNMESLNPVMNVLIYCQIFSFIFGILYGEVFGISLGTTHAGVPPWSPEPLYEMFGVTFAGDGHGTLSGLIPGFETIYLFEFPFTNEMVSFPFHRPDAVLTLIVLTAILGVIQINLGYVLGMVNVYRNHGIVDAILEKGSWIIIELGVVLAALGFLEYTPTTILGLAVFVIGFAMLFKGEGVKGAVELPSLLSNVLSYARIAAVGLSSIYIAYIVNEIAFVMLKPDTSILLAIFSIIVFIFGHALNTLLGVIAPGLQALRLQYVEFFTKFYEGGGKKYSPFGHIRKYTE